MQSIRLILTAFALLCSSNVSMAIEAFHSSSTISTIAGECLLTVLDCVMRAPEVDSAMSRWGKVEDPAGDCKFICKSETLSITVPGTHHALNPAVKNLLAPRVLREVAGDFSIEVKVKCFAPPASGSSTNLRAPNSSLVGSGILIWQDEKNFLRLSQAAMGDRQQRVIQLRVGDKLIFENAYTFDAEYLHLRVFRIGKSFGVSVSEDGKRWLAPVFTAQNFYKATKGFGEKIRAGVVVVNAIDQEIRGEFSELKLTNEPKSVVHDLFRGTYEFSKTPLAVLRDPRVQEELQLKPELVTALKALGTNPTQQGITNSQITDFFAALKELDALKQASPVTDRLAENTSLAQDPIVNAWEAVHPRFTEQQIKRLAGLAFQKHGPRSLLLDIVQAELNLQEPQLKSIENARKLLDDSVAMRSSSNPQTPELESRYGELRKRANELLTEVVRNASQERVDELRGDLFSFGLPGMVAREEVVADHPLGPLAYLLLQPAVQQELKLSDSVASAIDQFAEMKAGEVMAVMENLKLDISDSPSPVVVKAWEDAYWSIDSRSQELEVQCRQWLTAPQNMRLQQILFQNLGSQALLVSDSACDAIELSSKQRDDLQAIKSELAKSQNFSNLIHKSLRRAADVDALLTDKQREKLQDLKGVTFYFVPISR